MRYKRRFFISVYNFTAPQRALFGSQRILNFRVMSMRDKKLRSHLSKNIQLSHDLQPFQKLEHQEKCLCKCLFVKYRQSVAQIAKVSCRCLHYFPAAMLVHIRCAPTWRFHTELCKFLRNITTNICCLGERTDLKLGEVSSLFIFNRITIS